MTISDKSENRIETRAQIRVADLPTGREVEFELVFDVEQIARATTVLGILGLQKCRFSGRLIPSGRKDWLMRAKLGATVTQACVVTLEPVKTRLDETVTRLFVGDWDEPDAESVVQIDQDDESEALGTTIDLEALAIEAISLHMPDFPRKNGAVFQQTVFAQEGIKAMTDEEARPLAALAALKEKLEKP
jgi:uncharacterized metal-binding protein YceD (DUF177 family)